MRDTVTVNKIITEANSLETFERQMCNFQDKQNLSAVNKILTLKTKKNRWHII